MWAQAQAQAQEVVGLAEEEVVVVAVVIVVVRLVEEGLAAPCRRASAASACVVWRVDP